MKVKKIVLHSILLTLFLVSTSCSLLEMFESSKIKRFKSAEYKVNPTIQSGPKSLKDSLITIKLFGTKISKATEKKSSPTLWDLKDKGQAELVKALNNRHEKNEDYFKAIEKKYFVSKEKKIVTDYTEKNLKMVFSIAKKRRYSNINNSEQNTVGFSTADRVEYLKFNIILDPNDGLSFINWNKFQTEYKTINIADVSFDRTFSFTGGLNSSNSKTNSETDKSIENIESAYSSVNSKSPSLSGTSTSTNKETQKVNYRYLSLNGNLDDYKIEIEQEGIRDIDLSGNVIIDVKLKFSNYKESIHKITGYFDKEKKIQPSKKLTLKEIDVFVPDYKELDDISVKLNYEYIYRHVKNEKGAKTFYEWDDKVIFFEDKINDQEIKLLKLKDYMPAFEEIGYWAYKNVNGKRHYDEYFYLVLQNKFQNFYYTDLIFENYKDAEELRDWLLINAYNINEEIKLLEEKKIELMAASKSYKSINTKLDALKKKYESPIIIGNNILNFSNTYNNIEDRKIIKASFKSIYENRESITPIEKYYNRLSDEDVDRINKSK